ncbi:MAG: hypothetical protein ACR2JM_02885, partial [Mycobacterium sp.]
MTDERTDAGGVDDVDDVEDVEDFETEIDTDLDSEEAEEDVAETADSEPARPARADWRRLVVYGVLPALAVMLAAGTGVMRWKDMTYRHTETARERSVAAAREATVAMLSYKTATVEKDLMAARDRLTGEFLDSYTDLVKKNVIPAAKDKKISAQAQVQSASSDSASPDRAGVLVFLKHTVATGADNPTTTPSSARVTLDKVDGRW